MSVKELTEGAIKSKGLYKFLKRPTHFTQRYGSKSEKRKVINKVKEEWGFESGDFEVMTIQECVNCYRELVESELKSGKVSRVYNYVDVVAMIYDDLTSRYIDDVILENGNFYLVQEI